MSSKKKLGKIIGKILGNAAVRAATFASKRLNQRRIEILSNVIGWMGYRCSSRYRNVAIRNMSMTLGRDYGSNKIRIMVLEVFRNFCRAGLEFFFLSTASNTQINSMMEMKGQEHLEEALKRGKGVVLVTAHFGNWELLARKLCLLGYKLTVIARDSDDPGMTGIVNRIRERAGYKVLGRDRSIRGALECLKRNEVLGILPDQNTSFGGILVDFLGKKACAPTGPAVFALRTGAAVVPVFTPRNPDGTYSAVIHPPLEFSPTGDREADEYALTTEIQGIIASVVREYPTQWLWLHDRWKKARELGACSDAG